MIYKNQFLLLGMLLFASHQAFASASTLKCSGFDGIGVVTVTLNYQTGPEVNGQKTHLNSALYQIENDSKVSTENTIPGGGGAEGDDYSRKQRQLEPLDISTSDLGTVFTGVYTEERMGYDSAGVFNLSITVYKDVDTKSKIVVTHSYYSEAKGNVTENVLSLNSLSCQVSNPLSSNANKDAKPQ